MTMTISNLHVRRSGFINATPARVWQEFVDFDHLKAWFGLGHTLEAYAAEAGGTVRLSVDMGDERRAFGGPIVVFEPEHELSFESNWEPPHEWPVPTWFTIRLSALYEGTLVEIFHHGFERLGGDAADNLQSYEQGWSNQHLVALRSLIEG